MKHIVVIGAGFGGIYAVKRLAAKIPPDAEITLLNKHNYLLYTPMLHEVATGGLNRHSVVEPIRAVLRGKRVRFRECEALHIDLKKQEIETSDGTLHYDVLLVAAGSRPNFYNIPGAEKHALPLKSIGCANAIRNQIISSLEQAAKLSPAAQKPWLTFVVVGGGPTGVEIMGEMTEFVGQMLATDYREIDRKQVSFLLLHHGEVLVPQAHPSCSRMITKYVEKHSVDIRLESVATRVTAEGIELNKKEFVQSKTVIWTAGVKPNSIPTAPNVVNVNGRYPVDEMLRIKGMENVYAIGDCAEIIDAKGKRVPDLAQSAVVEGKHVADNIIALLKGGSQKPFVFHQKGFLVSVGKGKGVAEIGPFHFCGFFAWWLMRTIYLFKMLGRAQKFKVAFEWTIQLFSKRDTTQI